MPLLLGSVPARKGARRGPIRDHLHHLLNWPMAGFGDLHPSHQKHIKESEECRFNACKQTGVRESSLHLDNGEPVLIYCMMIMDAKRRY